MGSGRNGTFDIYPDWNQWAILLTSDATTDWAAPTFFYKYWKWFRAEIGILKLRSVEGHGQWDGRTIFHQLNQEDLTEFQPIAVLTRATIKLHKLKSFWKNVPAVAKKMNETNGLITSIGIGEVPFIKQATLSIWENQSAMKAFAYKLAEHRTVIQKTRSEKWYQEEMFVRFNIIEASGKLNGLSLKI